MTPPDAIDPNAFLSQLSEAITHSLLQTANNCDLSRGEFLMRQGQASAHVFMVESGGLLLLRSDPDGAEVALDLLGPGGLCGIEDVLCDRTYALSARATTQTVCHSIPSDVIRGIMNTDAPTATAIANYVAVRLRLAETHMEILVLESTVDRVARVLRRLARRYEPRSGSELRLPLTQGDLASLVGISRQSVNRSLRNLRLRGIVTCHARQIAVSKTLFS